MFIPESKENTILSLPAHQKEQQTKKASRGSLLLTN
jgi:hypothetical protein